MMGVRAAKWDSETRTIYVSPEVFAAITRLEGRLARINGIGFDHDAWYNGCVQVLGGPLPAEQWQIALAPDLRPW